MGASPLFPPEYQGPDEAKEALLHVVRRDPASFGIAASRWTLERIRQVASFLKEISLPGLSALLDRLGITYKRARSYHHSPDVAYVSKICTIGLLCGLARREQADPRLVTLFTDEATYYRQPSLARAYEARGHVQALARRSYRHDSQTRVVASLDVADGRVVYQQSSRLGVAELVGFYQKLRDAYPQAERIYLVQDNWLVHFHADVLAALEHQESPWPFPRAANWSDAPSRSALRRWGHLRLPIQLVQLPTYASWTNPIEKLWRFLRQEVLHLHRLADQLPELRTMVASFLDRFADGSKDLLRYTGLPVSD